MAKSKTTEPTTKRRPALTPEARDKQLIALAVDLAEKQLIEGTASAQVISHFLKLGSSKETLEKEKLEEENKLLRARTKALESGDEKKQLYKDAINAMLRYAGVDRDE